MTQPPDHGRQARRLVDAIRGPSARYKRAELDAIVAAQAHTVPVLLRTLEGWAADPAAAPKLDDGDCDVLYVIVLLAHLRVGAAHRPLVRLARQPEAILEPLLGDFVSDALPRALLATSERDVSGLWEILGDPEVGMYARAAAVNALAAACVLGWIPTEPTIEELFGWFDRIAEEEDSGFLVGVVFCALLDLGAQGPHRDRMIAAFETGAIEEGILDRGEIDSVSDPDDTEAAGIGRGIEQGLHEWIGWWAMFQSPPTPPSAPRPPAAKIGRNDACPCGSGKKYKRCCLDQGASFRPVATHAAAVPPRQEALAALHALSAERFLDDHLDAEEELWADLGERAPELAEREYIAEASEALLDAWFWFDRPLANGRTVVQHLLARPGALSPGAVAWLRGMAATAMHLYEVVDVRPGTSITFRDVVLGGSPVTVRERGLSREARRGHLFATRILAVGGSGEPEIELSCLPISPFVARSAVEQLEARRDAYRAEHPGHPELAFWKRMSPVFHDVWARSILDPVRPQLQNTDGEELVWTELHFEIVDEAALRAALDVAFEAGDEDWRWTSAGDADGSVSLGTVRIEGDRLVVTCNSRERAERARALVEGGAGEAVRHLATSHEDLASQLAAMARGER